ncbi:hypothetical protein [Paenibacillus sp. NPDC055715]
METRLIPVIEASGLRNYLETPGATYFEAAYNVNSLLSGAVILDKEKLELTEMEAAILERQSQCKRLREEMGELIALRLDALNNFRSPRKYSNKLNEISCEIFRLERANKKDLRQLGQVWK